MVSSSKKNKDDIIWNLELEAYCFRLQNFIKPNKLQSLKQKQTKQWGDKVYLGRPWRPYAKTLFMNCEIGSHITPAGWDNWRNPKNEETAEYSKCKNYGPGASTKGRVTWSHQLSKKEASKITIAEVFGEECW